MVVLAMRVVLMMRMMGVVVAMICMRMLSMVPMRLALVRGSSEPNATSELGGVIVLQLLNLLLEPSFLLGRKLILELLA